MRHDLGILFLHHDVDAVTRANLASIRRQHPRTTIVTMSAGKSFRGGYELAATPEVAQAHARNIRRGSDWLVCSWFLQKQERCDRWWIVEWDTYCRVSAREYYQAVWDFPFVASSVRLPQREPEWAWFRAAGELPAAYQPYALGAVPFLYLLTERALERICRRYLREPLLAGNAELRFATVANACGLPPCGFSPPHDQITWIECRPTRRRTIFHPVKRLG
ncbi:MAG: hypothetical protein U1F65_00065 [Verrucomicrobiota bacterium]